MYPATWDFWPVMQTGNHAGWDAEGDWCLENLSTTPEQAVEELAKHRILALDTETTGLDPITDDLVLVQIATPDDAYLFPAALPNLTELLRPLFEDPDRLWLIQYSPFDTGFLAKHLGLRPKKIYDTWYVERLLRTQGSKESVGLKAMVKRYLNMDLSKEARTTFTKAAGITEEQAEYGAIDALALFPIALAQTMRHAEKLGVAAPWSQIEANYLYTEGKGPKPGKPS